MSFSFTRTPNTWVLRDVGVFSCQKTRTVRKMITWKGVLVFSPKQSRLVTVIFFSTISQACWSPYFYRLCPGLRVAHCKGQFVMCCQDTMNGTIRILWQYARLQWRSPNVALVIICHRSDAHLNLQMHMQVVRMDNWEEHKCSPCHHLP